MHHLLYKHSIIHRPPLSCIAPVALCRPTRTCPGTAILPRGPRGLLIVMPSSVSRLMARAMASVYHMQSRRLEFGKGRGSLSRESARASIGPHPTSQIERRCTRTGHAAPASVPLSSVTSTKSTADDVRSDTFSASEFMATIAAAGSTPNAFCSNLAAPATTAVKSPLPAPISTNLNSERSVGERKKEAERRPCHG